jgi:pyruvate/2-oxoglutarate dehydrogenase complex dihydrolipoamide acyltransferase (E2) component
MSFKMPLKEGKRGVLKSSAYVKMLSLLLKKKYNDGMSVPFLIVLNQKYANLDEKKSEKLPLFLVGERDSSWKDFHKKPAGESTQKEFCIAGTCARQGDQLLLSIDGSKGLRKLPPKTKQYINAILAKIDKKLTIAVGAGSGDVASAAGAGAAEKALTPQQQQKKDEGQKEAQALSDAIGNLAKLMNSSLRSVTKNVKKGVTSGQDIKALQEVNDTFENVCKAYNSAMAGVRQKFKPTYTELEKKRKELFKLSAVAKARKKNLAQRLADSYYQDKLNRDARKAEIKKFNQILKDTIQYNKTSSPYKVDQKLLFRTLSFMVKKVGLRQYRPDLTDKVLAQVA